VFRDAAIPIARAIPPTRLVITGQVRRRSLYVCRGEWQCGVVNALRELRHYADLSQREFAQLLDVPVNTFRMWDSGLRPVPAPTLQRARDVVAHYQRQHELLPLVQLAKELRVHIRTLQAAVRTGRLEAHFSVKSVFGRPRRLATRAAAEQFMATHYRRFGGQKACPASLPTVPLDFDQQLRALRRRLRLTQAGLARRIGAACKAVVYQWESRKRTPSPVFWRRILHLDHRGTSAAPGPLASAPTSQRQPPGHSHRPGVPISGEVY
jgi:DNA-binding transcriptional regulator YiaG